MTVARARQDALRWSDSVLELSILLDEDGRPRLSHLGPAEPGAEPGEAEAHAGLPLVDVMVDGSGRTWAGLRYSESTVGHRMRYVRHERRIEPPWSDLVVELEDPDTQLVATIVYRFLLDGGVVRSSVRLVNDGERPLTVTSLTSFLGGDLAGSAGVVSDVDVLWAENDWLAEGRWHKRRFDDLLPQLRRRTRDALSRGRFGLTGIGSWSSGTYLPMGAAVNRRTGNTVLWQIEHNGAWHWQLGDHTDGQRASSYVALLGPTDAEHHWRATLAPGESFESVPVAVAFSADGFEDAVARLTSYRRSLRRKHDDHRRLPVIFNDYLNTLNADPTTERLLPLIGAAARVGAEYFCIDAGWYAKIDEPWWDAVGEWVPSTDRFPNGLIEVVDYVRANGMVPGLWIEPEVVGVRSPVADRLPPDAFFVRDGERVVEQGRYQLDLRHPAARSHLDRVVDGLVDRLGLGYLKMDYNINIAPGTDAGAAPAGSGMLGHNRAFLAWIDELLDRHPQLTIESCASGGMRTDYALLSRLQLQSASDQEDPLLYPPIVAALPVAVAPEQAAIWAPPQPDMDDAMIAFSIANAMLTRVHLTGRMDLMTDRQRDLVAQGVAVYKEIRADIATATPFWPLGLPKWDDPWIALGMRAAESAYVLVWRRDMPAAPESIELLIAPPETVGRARPLYPAASKSVVAWDGSAGVLRVTVPSAPGVCLVRVEGALPKRHSSPFLS